MDLDPSCKSQPPVTMPSLVMKNIGSASIPSNISSKVLLNSFSSFSDSFLPAERSWTMASKYAPSFLVQGVQIALLVCNKTSKLSSKKKLSIIPETSR